MSTINAAYWNVRSLVENEGNVETARVRKDERAVWTEKSLC